MARRAATKVSPIRETPTPEQFTASEQFTSQIVAANHHAARREPSEDEIRQRAYEIYAAGASPSRDAVEIWLQAEQELRASRRGDL